MLIPVIDHNHVRLSIPEPQLLVELGYTPFNSVQCLASLYIGVGGDRKLSFPEETSVGEIASTLEKKVEEVAFNALKPVIEFDVEDVTAVEWRTAIVDSKEGTRLLVAVELPYWTAISLCWFDHYLKKKPKIYRLFRAIITRIIETMPCNTSLNEIESYGLEDNYADDPESKAEVVKEKKAIKEFTKRALLSRAHLRRLNTKSSADLTKKEKQFVEMATNAIDMYEGIAWHKLPWLHDLPDEFANRSSSDRGFMITAGHDSWFTEWMFADANTSYSEYGPPIIFFKPRNREEISAIKEVIRFYQEYQKLFGFINDAFGEPYINRIKRAAKRKLERGIINHA